LRRGRPRDPAKREAAIAAARTLFLRDPAGNFTMDQVVVEAKIAKATLYAYFRDREALLEAVVWAELDRMLAEDWVRNHAEQPLEDILVGFGELFIGQIANGESQRFERILTVVTCRTPELGQRFYDAGPGRGYARLRSILAQAMERGEIVTDSIDEATEALLGLWQGFLRLQLEIGHRDPPDRSEVHRRSAAGVRTFLTAFGSSRRA
jgi:TetR/AcrR family transcriptional repressor of mexJK operon